MTDEKKLFWSCFYAFFFCGLVMLTIGSALPDIRAEYNLSASMGGALLSLYSLGNLLSGIISGAAALYLGSKFAIAILAGLVSVGMAAISFSHISIILFVAFALIGTGRGSMISFSQRTINIFTNGNPKITGLLHAVFALGAISAPLLFSALRVISWRAGIIFVLCLGLVAVCIFLSIKDYSMLDGSDSTHSGEKSLAFLREKGFIIISCLMFLYLCCEFALNGWLVTYMTHKNMSMRFSHSMAALLWVVMLVGRLVCASLSKYISQKNLLLISSIGSAIFFAFMILSEGKIFITLSVICVGFCMAGISPIIYAASAPYSNKYPLAMGILFTIGCTGGTLMPLTTGITAEYFGFDGGMSAILVTFILLVIFAAISRKYK